MRRWFLSFLIAALIAPSSSRAEAMHEFIMSCTYGVLAGTLVGAASLAFTDRPGDNLNRIARGASIGLYAGILLGVYIVYGVPSEEEQALDQQAQPEARLRSFERSPLSRVALVPTLTPDTQKVSGAVLSAEVWRF